MRPLLLSLVLAACSAPKPSDAPAARWEIDHDANLAVPVCPACDAPVLRNETQCPACGAAYRIEPKTIACPECEHGSPGCEACEGSSKCAICEGTGTFDGAACPECTGQETCPDCHGHAPPEQACGNCAGTGTIELR